MNWDKWKVLEDGNTPRDCMDRRHAEMLKAMLLGEVPATVVEIGCCNGFSTTAVAEAVTEGARIGHFDMCDPRVTNGMLWVASYILRAGTQVDIHAKASCIYGGSPECWLIDGDHVHGALFDYELARFRKARIITVHDSHNADLERHWGAVEIANRLEKEAVHFWHDAADRPGELTNRGLSIGFFYQPKPETLKALDELAAK